MGGSWVGSQHHNNGITVCVQELITAAGDLRQEPSPASADLAEKFR